MTSKLQSKIIAMLLCLSMVVSVGAVASIGNLFKFDGHVHAEETETEDDDDEDGPVTYYASSALAERTAYGDGPIKDGIHPGDAELTATSGTRFVPFTIGKSTSDKPEDNNRFIVVGAKTETNSGQDVSDTTTATGTIKPDRRINFGGTAQINDSKLDRMIIFRRTAGAVKLEISVWFTSGSGGTARKLKLVDANPLTVEFANISGKESEANDSATATKKVSFVLDTSKGEKIPTYLGIGSQSSSVGIHYIEIIEHSKETDHSSIEEIIVFPNCVDTGLAASYCEKHFANLDAALAATPTLTGDRATWAVGTYPTTVEGCNVVISEVSAKGHTYGAWGTGNTGDKAPTTDDFGQQSRKCSVCNDIETRVVPKIETGCVTTYLTEFIESKTITSGLHSLVYANGTSPLKWVGRGNAVASETHYVGSATEAKSVWKDFNISSTGVVSDLTKGPNSPLYRFKTGGASQSDGTSILTDDDTTKNPVVPANYTDIMPDTGYFTFTADADSTLVSFWAVSGNSGESDRSIIFYKADAEGKPTEVIEYQYVRSTNSESIAPITFSLDEAGNYAFGVGKNGINIYAMRIAEHDWKAETGADANGWVVGQEPDCETAGEKHRTCDDCGYVQSEVLAPLSDDGHHMTYTTAKEATCAEAGIKDGLCSICGATTSVPYNLDPHEHTVTFKNGDTVLGTLKFDCGDVIGTIQNYNVAGFKFDGWFTDAALTKAYVATTEFTGDVTLYGKYTAESSGGCGSVGVPSDMGGIFIVLAAMFSTLLATTLIKKRREEGTA